MSTYSHHISSIFSCRTHAEATYNKLIEKGIDAYQLTLRRVNFTLARNAPDKENIELPRSLLINTSFGMTIGAIAGMLTDLILPVAQPDVFASNPIIGPLILIGVGACIGGVLGTLRGVMKKMQLLPEESTFHAQFLLTIKTLDRQQISIAESVMETSAEGKGIYYPFAKNHKGATN
ncbi:MAG: hypothetical protein B0W54_20765 [Cellvibrio sp. 79]|nr:MAG: hypothetical protein B0W54_20765 [Cellvibrio sp. 79]